MLSGTGGAKLIFSLEEKRPLAEEKGDGTQNSIPDLLKFRALVGNNVTFNYFSTPDQLKKEVKPKHSIKDVTGSSN